MSDVESGWKNYWKLMSKELFLDFVVDVVVVIVLLGFYLILLLLPNQFSLCNQTYQLLYNVISISYGSYHNFDRALVLNLSHWVLIHDSSNNFT